MNLREVQREIASRTINGQVGCTNCTCVGYMAAARMRDRGEILGPEFVHHPDETCLIRPCKEHKGLTPFSWVAEIPAHAFDAFVEAQTSAFAIERMRHLVPRRGFEFL
jgi:hypothetical protein